MSNHITQEYSEIATRSLGTVLKGLEAINFYNTVIRNIDAGHDYTADVKVFKKAGPELAREVALEAIAEYQEQIDHAWDLPAVMQTDVETHVASTMDQLELLPRYDVRYVFKTSVGKLTVRIATKHLNSTVTVSVAGARRNHEAAIAEAEQWLSTYWMMRDVA